MKNIGWCILAIMAGIVGTYLCAWLFDLLVIPICVIIIAVANIGIKGGRVSAAISLTITYLSILLYWGAYLYLRIAHYPNYGNVLGIIFNIATLIATTGTYIFWLRAMTKKYY